MWCHYDMEVDLLTESNEVQRIGWPHAIPSSGDNGNVEMIDLHDRNKA